MCSACEATEFMMIGADCVCKSCGAIRTAFMGRVEKAPTTYRRINHFTRVLENWQCKGAARVTDEWLAAFVLDAAAADLPLDSYDHIREALRATGRRRPFYDHTCLILSRLQGNDSALLSAEQKRTINQLFLQLLMLWPKHAPPGAKNIFHTHFFLQKLVYVSGLDLDVPGAKAYAGYEDVWAAIAKDAGWI